MTYICNPLPLQRGVSACLIDVQRLTSFLYPFSYFIYFVCKDKTKLLASKQNWKIMFAF